ncbi:uroporphyrin-III C-methyltransferase [Paucibacter oligotrophus]|uniref:uroporphyrinogen-III C-methyltransferase n=1 Tax=Roseateles oligotrophus TaxID=1769250 RepID=A0A840L6L4_9BURK|nr:uroporphyrinogen-III C-methyltransferase [Roseateles oligotrophus]MBB4844214.1 uroporphyrin-III C-methyltransferase [Roseateles oligotrophus]
MSPRIEPRHFSRPQGRPQWAPVTLVGAGPGDPELLTLKAARALAEAELLLYDNLVSAEVMAMANPAAEKIFVGKKCGQHALSQEGIIALMIELVRGGRRVLRLKGGDPYIFGRGGEEAEALAAAGIAFETIPGISAAQAAGAAAGIPLTHRAHAGSLIYTTGHLRAAQGAGAGDEQALPLDWPMLARPHQTLVIYMGLNSLPLISRQLILHGLPAETPAALIENASLPQQRCVRGSLAELPQLALSHGLKSPTLLMIGEVTALHERLGPALYQQAELAQAGDHCKV